VLDEERFEQLDHDGGAPAGFGFGVDFALECVPAGVDLDPLEGELNLFDAQSSQLAESQPRRTPRQPAGTVALSRVEAHDEVRVEGRRDTS
jgi:hypothetical protein